jgi:hypothetical protein
MKTEKKNIDGTRLKYVESTGKYRSTYSAKILNPVKTLFGIPLRYEKRRSSGLIIRLTPAEWFRHLTRGDTWAHVLGRYLGLRGIKGKGIAFVGFAILEEFLQKETDEEENPADRFRAKGRNLSGAHIKRNKKKSPGRRK